MKSIVEYIVVGTVIFIGISIAIGLLVLIVSSLEDFFFNTKNKETWKNGFEEKNGNLESIAEYFNVSLATANQRLINLGLKDEKWYCYQTNWKN